jgi:catechol 2,3-dioxygenase-like lactoylglutathione lyase family enzyme
MSVRRIVPNIRTAGGPAAEGMRRSAEFYGLLGLREVMNHGWIMTLASASDPTAQLSVMGADATAPVTPDLSIEVEDVDAVHAAVRESGAEIVYPLRDEEWGVRRFFVRDPNGQVVNVLGHR